MAGTWKALLLLAGFTVVSSQRRLRYEDAVARALKLYNEGQQGQPLFRLLEAIPPSSQNSSSRIPLNFRIKETVCTAGQQRQPEECDFREGGEERSCRGEFSARRLQRFLAISCDRDCRGQTQVTGFAGPPLEDPPAKATELPRAIRNVYEEAKYNIISSILKNF